MRSMKQFLLSIAAAVMLPVSGVYATGYDFYHSFENKIYTMTNSTEGNELIELTHYASGEIFESNRFATGGNGTSGGLGNQGGIVTSDDKSLMFVVNAGSNSISVFKKTPWGIRLVETESSLGERPVSITQLHNLVYVLNAGSDSIAGFIVNAQGHLYPLKNSIAKLSGEATGAAQISFTPRGNALVVTEKATNFITTFPLYFGIPGEAIINISAGVTPFGFDFDRYGHLLVSEAAGGEQDASSVSSYAVSRFGALNELDGPVPTTETAACWLIVDKTGRYAYTTNAGSASISAYKVHPRGRLTLLNEDGVAASTGEGSAPIDLALSGNGRFLYALSARDGSVSAFVVGRHGTLESHTRMTDLPTGLNGLAVF